MAHVREQTAVQAFHLCLLHDDEDKDDLLKILAAEALRRILVERTRLLKQKYARRNNTTNLGSSASPINKLVSFPQFH